MRERPPTARRTRRPLVLAGLVLALPLLEACTLLVAGAAGAGAGYVAGQAAAEDVDDEDGED